MYYLVTTASNVGFVTESLSPNKDGYLEVKSIGDQTIFLVHPYTTSYIRQFEDKTSYEQYLSAMMGEAKSAQERRAKVDALLEKSNRIADDNLDGESWKS